MGKLNDIIAQYTDKNPVRFHMPGHKGKNFCFEYPEYSGNNLSYKSDITELFFTDNLYNPDLNMGLIYDLEKRISDCFFENKNIVSLILCGGATLCIQGAMLSLIRNNNSYNSYNRYNSENGKLYIICDRTSHISFINALSLLDINPLWVYPDENFTERINYFCGKYKNNHMINIIGAFATSPDYFGCMKNIFEISLECKRYSLPLVIDNSHGSHLAFYKNGSLHPINCGADISIDSVHKTLPALTGAAVIHANKNYGNDNKNNEIRECLKIFASTSPSFLILQSIENMIDYLEKAGKSEHARLINDIDLLRKRISESSELIGMFKTVNMNTETKELHDPYRIVLSAENSGEKLYYYLFENNITCEFFDKDNVIIIPSVLNHTEDFDKLFGVLKKFAEINPVKPGKGRKLHKYNFHVNHEIALSLNSAMKFPRETVLLENSIDRISAESVFAYPPGIPLVLPGERINEGIYNILKNMQGQKNQQNQIDVII